MNLNSELLLDAISAVTRWLDARMAQDAELKTILINIEASIKNTLPNKLITEKIEIPTSIIPAENNCNTPSIESVQTDPHSIIQPQPSPEKLAELQSKWTSPPHTSVILNPQIIDNKDLTSIYPINSLLDPKRIAQIRTCLLLKAESFCLQIDKSEEPDAPTEKAQNYLITKANAIGTRLWIFDVALSLCRSYPEQLADLSILYLLCADSSALLIELLNDIDNDQDNAFEEYLKESLMLVAEAQSMLKTALERVAFAYEDPDQKQLFCVVRDLTAQRQIYIPRYMRTKDQADPSLWRNLKTRIQDFAKRLELRQTHRQIVGAQQQAIKKTHGQINYHLKRIKDGIGVEHDWQRIADALTQWSESGLKPDDQRLRIALEPVTMFLPEMVKNDAQKLIYAYIQSWEMEDDGEDVAIAEDNELDDPAIQQVANWLQGRTVVLIGGNERPLAKAALIKAFGLEDVIWVSTRPHETLEVFKTPIRRDEVSLVILAIRWASHAYGSISAFCRQMDKPFIRLPAGYNPRRVAYEIISQASHAFD